MFDYRRPGAKLPRELRMPINRGKPSRWNRFLCWLLRHEWRIVRWREYRKRWHECILMDKYCSRCGLESYDATSPFAELDSEDLFFLMWTEKSP